MKRALKIILKILLWTIGSVLALLVAVLLLIRLPSVQQYITNKATAYVSSKTHTRVSLNRLYIGFPKAVVIEGLFAEDLQHDTLIYLGKLEADIDMLGLLHQNATVSSLLVADLNSHIKRSLPDSSFNFNFFIKAFASGKPAAPEPVDTTPSKWKISVNEIKLERINGSFLDEVSGMDMKANIGELALDVKDMDLASMRFNVDELRLADTKASIILTKAGVETPDTAAPAKLPLLALGTISLDNVNFYFSNKPSSQLLDFNIGHLQSHPQSIDLNRRHLALADFELSATTGIVAIKQDKSPAKPTAGTGPVKTDTLPGWSADADKISMEQVSFRFDVVNAPKQPRGMDYVHLGISDLKMDVRDARYSPERISADIRHISLRDRSGVVIKNFHAKAFYDDQHAELADLLLQTPGTTLTRSVKVSWPSLAALAKNPGELGVQADLRNCRVSLDEVLLFAPMVKDIPPFNGKRGQSISVSGVISGKLKDIQMRNVIVHTQTSTAIALDGHIRGLPDAQTAWYDLNLKTFATSRQDILALVPAKMIPVNVPEHVLLDGTFKGTFVDFKTNMHLRSSSGEVIVDATMRKSGNDTLYTASVQTKAFDLGYLLRQPATLGPVTLKTDIKGKNLTPARMNTNVNAVIESIVLNRYNYRNIVLKADAIQNTFAASLSINDSNIEMNLNAGVSLIDKAEGVFAVIDLQGADLHALNLTQSAIRTSGRFDADLKGKEIGDMTGRLSLNKIVVIKNDQHYRIDSFLVASVNDKKHSALRIKSAMLNLDYEGTLTIANLQAAITHHIDHYINVTNDPEVVEKDTAEQAFKLRIKIIPQPILSEVLLPDLKKFNGADIAVDFNNNKQQLQLTMNVPVIDYGGNRINKLTADVHSDKDAINYSFSFESFRSGKIQLPVTSFSGDIAKRTMNFELNINDPDSGNRLLVSGNLKQLENEYRLHFNEDKFVLNNHKWNVPADNFISFQKAGFYAHALVLKDQQQELSISSASSTPNAPLKVEFKQFQLQTLSQIAEQDTALLRGVLNGVFELRNLDKQAAFVSDLRISNIVVQNSPLGDLAIRADNNTANKYIAHVTLSGNDNDAKIDASYTTVGNTPLDVKVVLNKLNLASVEKFSGGQIRRSKGYLKGTITVRGALSKPEINGDINFRQAGFNVAYINNYIMLEDDHIKIDPKGIYFNSFVILDTLRQKAQINGAVYTSDFTKMRFDLQIVTNNFTVLNTRYRDNQLYFGHVVLSSNIRIRGDESLPVINANAHLINGSRIVVVVPSSQLSTDKGTGVVLLVDTGSKDRIMARVDSVQLTNTFQGLDLTANIEIDKKTIFKVIVDRVSGDSLVVQGQGNLSFGLDPSGKQSLTGTYTLSSGSYNASFQKVIKRAFSIKPGSSITWNGSPMDANVDITAVYRTKTSPASLLSTELSGSSSSEMSAYRKLLTFDVDMSMKGSLMRPEITFMIDMSDKDKNAFGGLVYSKIQTLNADPQELNKQVFSLLVMNKFLPSGNTETGEQSATSSIARNSVNQVLSDQLNQISGKYVKNVELNFDIQSNDDYTANSVQQNTEVSVGLKKEFYNSRISVQVGSSLNVQQDGGSMPTNASGLTGDVIVEYKLTDDGRYRVKAFRDNQYEGIIDGLLYRTGLGVLYTRDYDTFKELMSKPKKEEEIGIEGSKDEEKKAQ